MAYAIEEYQLPSNGVFPGIPKKVSIRNMTTAEEKMLLGSSDEAFDTIISKCIAEPEHLQMENLIVADRHFLLIKLRVVSYGPEYHFTFKCPNCGKITEFSCNLDELEVNYLPEDFHNPYDTFELPVTKDVVALKLPTQGDMKEVRQKTKRWQKKFPEQIGDPSLIFGMMANIATVNDKEMTGSPFQRWVEELPAKDASFIRNRINKLNIGIDTSMVEVCPGCHEDLEFSLPMGPDFFHSRLGE